MGNISQTVGNGNVPTKVSVVLPVYINKDKNIADTYKCIDLLRKHTEIPFQLVIVETASQYFIDSADIYLYEPVKTNPNTSINRAFRLCDGEFVVFIGNDVLVESSWLECLLECFKKPDCGIATLGNNEHRDVKHTKIVEQIYFSICMFKKEDAWFDPFYTYIFDDTDLVMRIYVSGRKSYKNLDCIVTHQPHSTYGKYCGNMDEHNRSKKYFMLKWEAYKDHPIWPLLTQ